MSTLFEKRGVWYYQYTLHGKRRSKSLKTKDKQNAKRLQKIFDGKLEQRALGLTQKSTRVADALNSLLELKKEILKPGTFNRYREIVKNLSAISVEFCHKLTAEDLNDYIRHRRKEGRANKTIHEELAILKAAITRACPRSEIESVLKEWPSLKRAVRKAETVGHYSLDDIEQLKAYFKGKEFERLFLFALYTGCRRSELHDLKWSSVDLRGGQVKIRNIKTESSGKNQFRVVGLHSCLKSILGDPGRPSDLVFPEVKKHSRNWPAIQLETACKDCGIQYRRFHGLRHTTATFLLAAGVSLRDVMQIMGWSRLETAQRYIHSASDASQEISKLPY